MTESAQSGIGLPERSQLSLATEAARNLATTTKTVPQMQAITSRWLLRLLPWVQVSGGVYRVNRRLTYTVGDGRVTFSTTGSEVRVVPPELCELPPLRGFDDAPVLEELAGRFVQRDVGAGEVIVEAGRPADRLFLIAHGRVEKIGTGKYGDQTVLGLLADGDYFGERTLLDAGGAWEHTYRAATPCTVLTLASSVFQEIADRSAGLRAQLAAFRSAPSGDQNAQGEAAIDVASGHAGEPVLPGTFVDYELSPREYELSVAQTVLRVHTRVADLYSEPMNQVEQQLRLTIEALRERQEGDLVNAPGFGLLPNAHPRQRIRARQGPPTPDDLDELLSRRRRSNFFLAHPRAIAAFGRECSRRGVYPRATEVDGAPVIAWRGVPILPCDKIPISRAHTTSILVLRTGLEHEGVIGLRRTGLPDEYEPGLSVRLTGVDERAIASYLVSAYYSAAVLVPDALGVLEDAEIAR